MRSLFAALPPVAAVAVAWGILEEPRRPIDFGFAALAGLAVGLASRRGWLATVATLAGAAIVACAASSTLPPAAAGRVLRGLGDASVVNSPFDPAAQRPLHALVVAACFLLCALVTREVVAGRSLQAGVIAALGVTWPVTLVERNLVAWGCVALGVMLWPSLAQRVNGAFAAVAGAAGLAAALLVTASAGAVGVGPEQAHVDWRGWNPLGGERARVGVRYVWNADYTGVRFPTRPTVVLRIRAPRRALYWRASTLDVFVADRWIENLYPVDIGPPRRTLPRDPLLPPGATRDVVRQTVTVEALDEPRLVATSEPVRVDSASITRVMFTSGGVMVAPDGIDGGDSYVVWSYAPSPAPAALATSPARYPAATNRYLELGRTRMPVFGAPDRAGRVAAILADDVRYPDLHPYASVWREARRLTSGTTSPYLATLAIERWLRTAGGYVYTEQPPPPPAGVPPLADFAVGSRLGYCQQFAGTMALMLRTLGIPSRVAVGFTSGRWSEGEWIVTDYDAHAWVEAWFAGYGWLPFDPTPGRGTFSSEYSFAGDSADAVRALGTGRFLDFSPQPFGGPGTPAITPPARPVPGREIPIWPLVLLSVPVAGLVSVAAKRHARRGRVGRPDPRTRAAGIRLELVDHVRDHGVRISRGAPLAEVAVAGERHFGVSARRLVDLALVARYAPPELARPAADDAAAELGVVEAAIRAEVGTLRSALAAVRPRLSR